MLRELRYQPSIDPAIRNIWEATLHRGQPPATLAWPPLPLHGEYLATLHSAFPGTHHMWIFWQEIEQGGNVFGTHNSGHRWIGGHMGRSASPNDPIFWLHHANVDRIWALWQEFHAQFPHTPDRVDDYVPDGAIQPWNGVPAPTGHYLDDLIWPWVGSGSASYSLDMTSLTNQGFNAHALRDMLIDYSGETARTIRDVLDPAQVHGGYRYEPPHP